MAAQRQRSKSIKVFNPLEDISLSILIAFMYNSCKTPSPILIPGYKFTKTLQMVSLDDVTTTFVPSSHKCSGNETESTSLQTAEERGVSVNYYNFVRTGISRFRLR